MTFSSQLNHVNFAVPPENLALLEACFAAILPWECYVKRDTLTGYRLGEGPDANLLFIRPAEAAGELARVVSRVRRIVPDLDRALTKVEYTVADLGDHLGFSVENIEEWESLLARFEVAAHSHPEWQLSVVDVHRPGDPNALTDRIFQAWLRIGLLGPIRNTLEMQCENPEASQLYPS